MVEIIDPLQGGIAALGSGVTLSGGWLVNKLWVMYRHEIKNMKEVSTRTLDLLDRHLEDDQQVHREMIATLGELKGYLQARREERERDSSIR